MRCDPAPSTYKTIDVSIAQATTPTSATTRRLAAVHQRGARTDSGAAAHGVGSLPSRSLVATACSLALLTSVLMARNRPSPLGRQLDFGARRLGVRPSARDVVDRAVERGARKRGHDRKCTQHREGV